MRREGRLVSFQELYGWIQRDKHRLQHENDFLDLAQKNRLEALRAQRLVAIGRRMGAMCDEIPARVFWDATVKLTCGIR
jgi:hypothetical protein